jgi:guanylate kinase
LPPSRQELENRLNKRGQDSAEVIAKRMNEAVSEMSHYDEYDYVLINDDFQQTLANFEHIVLGQRQRLANQQVKSPQLLEELLAKS